MYEAVFGGDLEEVKEILRNPGLDVNWECNADWDYTALQRACSNGFDSIISILLAHPDIDVNQENIYVGWSPFMIACDSESPSCARLLLKDSRVKVNEPVNGGHTPLCWLARQGHLDIIKWWIAFGREMDLGTPGDSSTDAIGEAEERRKTEVVTLLERFKENPVETRHVVRVELGLVDELAADVFAMVVFVSDGLLKTNDTTPSPAARFFSIAAQLPLELQMVLCYRLRGSGKEIIPGKESEVAFKELARRI